MEGLLLEKGAQYTEAGSQVNEPNLQSLPGAADSNENAS